MSIPSRFLEEVPSQLIENLGGPSAAQSSSWSIPGYGTGARFGAVRRAGQSGDLADRHYNYEDENQETPRVSANPGGSGRRGFGADGSSSKPFVASWMKTGAKADSPGHEAPAKNTTAGATPNSIDNIARFFGGKSGQGKAGSLSRPASTNPAMNLPEANGATNLKKGQRVRHAKYGEGTILMREGDGEDAKLTILFVHHGVKKLMEKFANLRKI
jgi:DNA helicase-2/ATP-dependent DNA helicase PcrA